MPTSFHVGVNCWLCWKNFTTVFIARLFFRAAILNVVAHGHINLTCRAFLCMRTVPPVLVYGCSVHRWHVRMQTKRHRCTVHCILGWLWLGNPRRQWGPEDCKSGSAALQHKRHPKVHILIFFEHLCKREGEDQKKKYCYKELSSALHGAYITIYLWRAVDLHRCSVHPHANSPIAVKWDASRMCSEMSHWEQWLCLCTCCVSIDSNLKVIYSHTMLKREPIANLQQNNQNGWHPFL